MEINKENVLKYAKRYDANAKLADVFVEKKTKAVLQKQRFIKQQELVEIGIWKSPRQKRRYATNDDLTVRELTKFSFSAKSERAKMGALLALNGVSYPVASVILHFAFPNQYPILDFRALWSLGWKQPSSYNFNFWQKYCNEIRKISKKLNLPLRVIDKALWQYSKENQK